MADTTVSTTAGLSSAINSASPGDTIFLQPGTYSGLEKYGNTKAGKITIRSLDPDNRAKLTYFRINECSNFTLTDLEFDLTGATNAFEVWNCDDFDITHSYFHGPLAGTFLDVIDDVVTALDTRWCARLKITDNEFFRLYNGVGTNDHQNFEARRNKFHYIRCDGIDLVQINVGAVTDNFFTEFYPQGDVGGDGDHPDAIQIFLNDKAGGSNDLTITGNKVVRGGGHQIQGVTAFQEDATKSVANALIQGNVFVGCSYNTIHFQGSSGVQITDNILAPYPDEVGFISARDCTSPVITSNRTPSVVTTGSTGVTNTGNTAGSWHTINPGADEDLSKVEALSYATVSTSETPASGVAFSTVAYHEGAGDTGALVTTSISVDIVA